MFRRRLKIRQGVIARLFVMSGTTLTCTTDCEPFIICILFNRSVFSGSIFFHSPVSLHDFFLSSVKPETFIAHATNWLQSFCACLSLNLRSHTHCPTIREGRTSSLTTILFEARRENLLFLLHHSSRCCSITSELWRCALLSDLNLTSVLLLTSFRILLPAYLCLTNVLENRKRFGKRLDASSHWIYGFLM